MTLAVALHDSGAPPVFCTVNCVCAATQVESVMLLGCTLRVAGIGVAVVAVGVAAERRVVAVGALPCAVAVADAPEKDCDDELEFADESLLEKGASVMLKLRWRNTKRSAATSKAARTAACAQAQRTQESTGRRARRLRNVRRWPDGVARLRLIGGRRASGRGSLLARVTRDTKRFRGGRVTDQAVSGGERFWRQERATGPTIPWCHPDHLRL